MSGESLYREIIEVIESELGMNADDFDIEVDDGFVYIWGAVPSRQAQEELERFLFDNLGLEDVDYDVVVDEDLQSQGDSLPDADPDEYGFGGTPEIDDGDLGSQTPRRQY
ncbi:MAG: hypothetical protein ABEJ65_03430 [bacterium]